MAIDFPASADLEVPPGLMSRQQTRIVESLAAEEAAGRLLALKGRTISLAIIAFCLLLLVPWPDVLFYELLLGVFIAAGFARQGLEYAGLYRWWQGYVQVAADYALLAFTLIVPNPLTVLPLPLQMELRFGNFVYFYILLVGLAFSYQPKLVIWGGVTGALAWIIVSAWIISLPDTTLTMPDIASGEQMWQSMLKPTFVDLDGIFRDIVVFLIVSALLATVVARSRRLVERQASLERERGNLARYFPPATVDRLARQDAALAQVREQEVAVLFADLVGFTHWAERHAPHEVIALLREVHARLEDEVFRRHGTLDKFIGDGLMATFGTPDAGNHDATNAVLCMKSIIDDFTHWNERRRTRGKAPIQIAVGLHYGTVVVGNIGNERRLEFAVLGDTVNVASRLEALTRELGCAALMSDAVAAAVGSEDSDEAREVLEGLVELGAVKLKGRDQEVNVLAYGRR